MNEKYDVVIVGAGIIGACIAFEMAKKGYKTLNIDKLPSAGYGSTSNSCGVIRVHYSTFDGTALAYEGLYYWLNWEKYLGFQDEKGLAPFHKTGCLVFKTDLNKNLETITGHLKDFGIEYEDWDPERIREELPIYDTHRFWPVTLPDDPGFGRHDGSEVSGAIYYPNAGYVGDPQLATHNVQRAAENSGAQFQFNAEVTEIRQTDGRVTGVVLKDGRKIDAGVVVNAAGPHSYIINGLAGVETAMNIKTRALRVEVAHVASPGDFQFEGRAPVISDGDIGVYSRAEVGNHILIGSEDPECDPREYVDPDAYNRNLSEQARIQVMRMAQRIPDLGIPNQVKGIVDLYDVADDWIPIYDRSDLKGFYMAIGTSGNQFKNAPVVGTMMTELIEACEKGHDHDRDPVQLYMPYTGRTISTGFFSRNREINRESSFSVLG